MQAVFLIYFANLLLAAEESGNAQFIRLRSLRLLRSRLVGRLLVFRLLTVSRRHGRIAEYGLLRHRLLGSRLIGRLLEIGRASCRERV